MNLYHVTQGENTGYDTFDACIVCAPDEEAARNMPPSQFLPLDKWGSWASSPDRVAVTLIGVADPTVPPGVVLASFNAG